MNKKAIEKVLKKLKMEKIKESWNENGKKEQRRKTKKIKRTKMGKETKSFKICCIEE